MKPATILIWLLALLPTFIGAVILIDVNWESPFSVLSALGRLAGIAGLAFVLVSAVLCCRVPGFDRLFGGLTRLWQSHHMLGALGFVLLLAHPLLLALARGDTLTGATTVLFPGDGPWALWAGWVGLILLMAFLGPSFSFFGQPPYQRWKMIHMLSGPAIIFSLVHAFHYDRAIPAPWDYVVWGTLSVLAIAAMGYRWAFSRWQLPGPGGQYRYQVTAVDAITPGVTEVSFTPDSRELHYAAGQFAYLTPFDSTLESGYGEEHPFTISSAPNESVMRMTIKDLGDASRALQHIRIGSEVRIEGPYGDFFQETGAAELWIAGGIGISPFLSRARYLYSQGHAVDICLVMCGQDESRALFIDELTKIASSLPGFAFHMHYFYKEGPLTRAFIDQHCAAAEKREFYICGPTPLLSIARGIAIESGVPVSKIHTEEFNLL